MICSFMCSVPGEPFAGELGSRESAAPAQQHPRGPSRALPHQHRHGHGLHLRQVV